MPSPRSSSTATSLSPAAATLTAAERLLLLLATATATSGCSSMVRQSSSHMAGAFVAAAAGRAGRQGRSLAAPPAAAAMAAASVEFMGVDARGVGIMRGGGTVPNAMSARGDERLTRALSSLSPSFASSHQLSLSCLLPPLSLCSPSRLPSLSSSALLMAPGRSSSDSAASAYRNGSADSAAELKDDQSRNEKRRKKRSGKSAGRRRRSDPTSDTGGLRRLPVVRPPSELLFSALRTARSVPADANLRNARNRARKHGAETMQALTKALCVPLRDCVKGYRRELRGLHPFERTVADLTARAREKRDGLTLADVLDELNEARKELLLAGKDWTARAKSADTAREASDAMREGEARMSELFEQLAAAPLSGLLQLQKSLRTTPAVRLDTPAVVLVGAPNVGKSSIVRAISSGTPEVNNYPFTTRGMTLGHVEVFWEDDASAAAALIPLTDEELREEGQKKLGEFERSVEMERVVGRYAFSQLCQIMDSPGLLVRSSEEERNEMEALTLAAMSHLPTAVMFVMDLSGGAGDRCSSVADQLRLRREVRARFPRRPWIDVLSKSDLGVVDGAREELEEILDGGSYLEVSVTDGMGVDNLRGEVMRMLEEVRVVLDAMAAVDGRTARSTN